MLWIVWMGCVVDGTAKGSPVVVDCQAAPEVLTDDPDLPVDWVIDCGLTVTGELVIEAGTTVSFGPDGGISTDGGVILAEGSADAPITLQATNAESPWHGVSLFGTSESRFSHVTFSGAGAENTWGSGGLVVGEPTYAAGTVSIRDCVFEGSVAYGLRVGLGTITSFSGNTFRDNEVAMGVSIDAVGGLADATFENNRQEVVDVLATGLPDGTAKVWPALSVPYRISGFLGVDSEDTLEAGVEVLMGKEAMLATISGPERAGSLTTLGTAADPVVFRGEDPTPGSWNAVVIGVGAGNFQHTKFHGARGSHDAFDQNGMVTLDANSGGTLEIRDCVLEASTGWGLWLGSDAYNDDVATTNTFRDNLEGDIHYP